MQSRQSACNRVIMYNNQVEVSVLPRLSRVNGDAFEVQWSVARSVALRSP